MRNVLRIFGIILLLSMPLFSFIMCTPISNSESADILLINQYHEPIIKVISGNAIINVSIPQGGSKNISSVPGAVSDLYVITNDDIVSNTIRVTFSQLIDEIITLNEDGILVNNYDVEH
jgi:hypothetical protein